MLGDKSKQEKAHNAPHSTAEQAIKRILADPALYQAVGARLLSLTDIPDDRSKCWTWVGAQRGKSGYGNFKIVSNVTVSAHRVAYAMSAGEAPGSMFVCHRCDNPKCVNPDHLFLGTHEENMADMAEKGRAFSADAEGSKNNNAKLTEVDAMEAMAMMACGKTNKEIAERFGVTHAAISAIRTGKSWKNLPRPTKFKKYGSLRR